MTWMGLRDAKPQKGGEARIPFLGLVGIVTDTYKVLKSSVAGPLNESLQEVINSGALLLIRDANTACLAG
jgi:hypothetical protein